MKMSASTNMIRNRISVVMLSLALVFIGVPKVFSNTNEIPLWGAPRAIPDIDFYDEPGNPTSLDKWLGKVVVLNIWATWCTPCRIEMPTLDRLQRELGGDQFEVVALSIDEASKEVL